MNEHAEIIANTVFHTFPYNMLVPNFKGPHAEDCGGCIINAEVAKLVHKLNMLSPVEDIIAELEKEKEKREALTQDRWDAFDKAGVEKAGSVAELVEDLVAQRNRLLHLVEAIDIDLEGIRDKIKIEEK